MILLGYSSSLICFAQQGFTWPHLYIIVPRMILSKLKTNYNCYNHLELEATSIRKTSKVTGTIYSNEE